ncbi:hypothetical protein PVAND_010623 [Polypedilum vanderplanki]|uniref:Nuclear pore complex protein Nup153 n=1 Tax=Polypedilum vanderplanki TaxID=319348 RepID=A0A9J6CHC0_POLVA|nr:hypothetical protein PVAND_010623 [Polypedilum vanderplanki]
MRKSADAIDEIKEIKNISGRRSIREGVDNYIYDETLLNRKKAINNNEDRSISEPPQSRYNNHTVSDSVRLKTIREKMDDDNNQCSSDEDLSKSNSQLNGSDLDLEIPESASQTPTPTPLNQLMGGNARRINSETNLNDSKRRLTGFMGNKSKRFCASTSELSFSSHLETNKSLFSPKNNRGSRSGSLYGSNMSLNSSNNSRLFMVNSPFYNGKTTFGGASAYPRKDINQHKILRNPIQMRPSSSLSNSSNTSTKSEGAAGYNMPESNAAKRILEIMTQFSGPLKETRNMGNNINSMMKIPGLVQNRKRFGEEDLQLNRSIALSRPSAPYARSIGGTQTAAPPKNTPESIASSLLNTSSPSPQIPTMSQLLKMKRLQNYTERAREIANRSENFLNQVHEYKLPSSNDDFESKRGGSTMENNSSSSSLLKMKNNITKNLLRNDKTVFDQPPEPLNLPNIQLPELKSYPKFDIKLPVTTTESNANSYSKNKSIETPSMEMSTISSHNVNTNEKTSSLKSISTTNRDNFKFSMPIIFDSDSETVDTSRIITNDKFIFSKPINIKEIENVNTTNVHFDIKSQQSTVKDDLFKNLVAKQNSQWECSSCLSRNDNEKTKCLCCDTVRQSNNSTTTLKPKETSPIVTTQPDDLFKKLAAQQKKSQWECDACMTKNDLDKEKCLCCETPKPGNKPAASTNSSLLSTTSSSTLGFKFGMPSTVETTTKPIASDDLFKSLAAQQKKSQWECDACMTKNDLDKEKCVCCETPKPGSSSTSNKSLSSSFSFGIKPAAIETSAKFSFGMPATTTSNNTTSSPDPGFKKILEKQNANWECSACMTRNEQSQSKCICCEQVKPGSSGNQASFSFASKKVSSIVSLPTPSEVKFSFGMQSAQTDSSTVEKKNNDQGEVNKEQKKDEVDKPVSTGFSFGSSPAGFKFGSNTNTTETKPAYSESNTTASFTFKAPANNIASTSFTLPAPKAEENKELTENKEENKPLKSCFGSSVPEVKTQEKKVSFDIDTNKEIAKSTERPGGFSFSPSTTSVSTSVASSLFGNASTTIASSNNGITFGIPSLTKPAEETKSTENTASKPSVSAGGFQFLASLPVSNTSSAGFTFGAKTSETSSTTTSIPSTQTTNFSFGTPKIANNDVSKTTTFGSIAATSTSSTTFSTFSPAIVSAPAPVFGSSSTFVFGNAKKDENTVPAQSSGGFSFTAKLPSSNMVFGNQNTTPSITPVFGSTNSMPTFGSNINSTPLTNNNESAFGSKMNSFGSIQTSTPALNQSQKRSFDFGNAVSAPTEGSQSKKFDFGSQQSQTNSAPFTFNAQPETKPAYSFSAAPAFNFTANSNTGNINAGNNTQENLFQFGANNSSTTQGIFAFGGNTQQPPQQQPIQPVLPTPSIMNFGATVPNVAIGGLTAAFNPGTGGASPQRKILRANRRNVTRR